MSGSADSLIPIGSRLITQAIEYDNQKQYTEALVCYQEGIQVFLNALKLVSPENSRKKAALRENIEDYMSRAEKVKKIINQMKAEGRYHEQIKIQENSTNSGYKQLFSRFLEYGDVNEVVVEDSYIRSMNQIQNFAHFCSVLVRSASPVKRIILFTGKDNQPKKLGQQEELLKEIQADLLKYDITFTFEFKDTLHDREIRFDNGWIVKIGRGLDYLKKPSSLVSLAFHDYDLRCCLETTIDIFHQSTLKPSNS